MGLFNYYMHFTLYCLKQSVNIKYKEEWKMRVGRLSYLYCSKSNVVEYVRDNLLKYNEKFE